MREHGTLFADDLIGGYLVERFLGTGRVCEKYSIFHPQLEIHRILKVVRPELAEQYPELKEHFLQEIREIVRCRHRNMVPVCDFGCDVSRGGLLYYITEDLPGGTLAEKMQSGKPMDESSALKIVRAAAEILQQLETIGRPHRDIAPENIILNEQRGAIAAEPGLTIGTGRPEQENRFRDVTFSAPELMQDPEAADIRSDLYSLGKLWFFMLTARMPEGAQNPRKLVPGIYPDSAKLIQEMLAPDPSGRPGSASALLAEIARLPGGMDLDNPELQKLAAEKVDQTVADRTQQLAQSLQIKQKTERTAWQIGLIAAGAMTVLLLVRAIWLSADCFIQNHRQTAKNKEVTELENQLADLSEQENTLRKSLQNARKSAEAFERDFEKYKQFIRRTGK